MILEEVPANPNLPEFEGGNTITYAWINDENTLRKAGGTTDPYALFEKHLLSGNPLSHWDNLLAQSTELVLAKTPTRTKSKSRKLTHRTS